MNKSPLSTDAFDDVITPISCIYITGIDDIERSRSYSLIIDRYRQVFYGTLWKIPPSVLLEIKFE